MPAPPRDAGKGKRGRETGSQRMAQFIETFSASQCIDRNKLLWFTKIAKQHLSSY